MQVLHFFFKGKSAWQIFFLMLREFVMHLHEYYDTFAQDIFFFFKINDGSLDQNVHDVDRIWRQ